MCAPSFLVHARLMTCLRVHTCTDLEGTLITNEKLTYSIYNYNEEHSNDNKILFDKIPKFYTIFN